MMAGVPEARASANASVQHRHLPDPAASDHARRPGIPGLAVEEAAAVPVMIWSLDDFGAFLDYASRHRMALLF